ncbi:hypothetical protein RJ639_007962 [Escallonia herrerae]|uniref:Retrotransposon gag domain-containing protein n=1 Tax=Escallonia herrerae TaxID=1293975 RepID=A0AA88VT05_9ASTE|nr:hypothetical protein RJ639_007962 [Escallonia herrerae]
MPQCDLYDGTGDPGEHVYQFETNMLLLQVSDAVMCRAFPTTLRKAAHAWFKSLQLRSVYSFGKLSDLFQKNFRTAGEEKEEQKKRSRELTPQGGKPTTRSKRDERRPKDPFTSENLTPLNAKPSQILHEIKDNKALQWPDKMRSRQNKRNKDLWCHYHNDHGHTTDNCGSLKRAIEAPIKRDQLRRFVVHKDGQQQTPPAVEERED